LLWTQPDGLKRSSISITKFNLKRFAISQQLNHGSNLTTPQVASGKINGQRYDINNLTVFFFTRTTSKNYRG
jgi:hypothetical protein